MDKDALRRAKKLLADHGGGEPEDGVYALPGYDHDGKELKPPDSYGTGLGGEHTERVWEEILFRFNEVDLYKKKHIDSPLTNASRRMRRY